MKKIAFLIILSGCISLFYPPSVVHMQSNLAVPETRPPVDLANDPRVPWLKKNAVNIRSVDPSDTDFSDLMPLKKAIGDAQVVMLGEATHSDGKTTLAKGRLIKFLHEKMGFDVLAFESGFHTVDRAWRAIKAGEDVDKAMVTSVFGNLSWNEEFRPLIEYINIQSKTKKPLEIAGFDSQFSGVKSQLLLLASDLRDFFKEAGVQTTALDEGSSFYEQLRADLPDQAFMDTLADLRKQVAAKTTKANLSKLAFGIQLLESIEANARSVRLSAEAKEKNFTQEQKNRSGMFEVRDHQMARNLIWLAQVRYPKRKIIVSAATAHIGYSDIYLKDSFFKNKWRDVELPMMGFGVHQALGSKAYSISFTAYEGKAGVISDDPKSVWTIKTDQRPGIQVEDLFHATGMEYAFIDLRKISKGGEWLGKPFISRVGGGYGAMEGQWNMHLDGIFYIREEKPVNRRKDLCPLVGEKTCRLFRL